MCINTIYYNIYSNVKMLYVRTFSLALLLCGFSVSLINIISFRFKLLCISHSHIIFYSISLHAFQTHHTIHNIGRIYILIYKIYTYYYLNEPEDQLPIPHTECGIVKCLWYWLKYNMEHCCI